MCAVQDGAWSGDAGDLHSGGGTSAVAACHLRGDQ